MNDPFEIRKMTDKQRDESRTAGNVGASGVAVALGRNKIGGAIQAGEAARGRRVVRRAEANIANLKSQKAKPQAKTWAAEGKPLGMTGGAARRSANKDRAAKIKVAQAKINRGNKIIHNAPELGGKAGQVMLRAGLVGAPVAYAGYRQSLKKAATKRDLDSAVVGGGAGAGAYHGLSMGSKPLERKISAKTKNMPGSAATLKAHRKAHGINAQTRPGDSKWLGFFRKYPKDLPGAKFKRAVSYTHGGKTGLAVQGAVVAGSAGAAVKMSRDREKVKKNMSVSAFGVDHGYDIAKNKLPVKYVAEGAKEGTRAAGSDKVKILGRMGPGKRSEFKRGFEGGVKGQATLHGVKKTPSIKYALPGAKDAFKQAQKNQANMSSRPKSFKAGTAAGKAAGVAATHPNTTVGVAIGGPTAAVVANDIKNDKKRKKS